MTDVRYTYHQRVPYFSAADCSEIVSRNNDARKNKWGTRRFSERSAAEKYGQGKIRNHPQIHPRQKCASAC